MRPRTPLSLSRALVLALFIGSSASAADPLLVPPAPNPVPSVPNAMNPVPGRPNPPVACPPAQVVNRTPCWYVWGLGVMRVDSPSGYRIGVPYEPLEVTSRRLDPQALPTIPVAREPSAQQHALALLRAARWDEASSALNVLVSHARHRASGVLFAPPGSPAPSAPVQNAPAPSTAGAAQPATPAQAGSNTTNAPPVTSPAQPPALTPPVIPPPPTEPQWSIGETQRLLALALLGQKRAPQAARVLAEAYANEPELCERPIPTDILGSSESLRRLMLRAVTHAQSSAQSADAWFAAAVLMQAQGRASLPPTIAARIRPHPLGPRLLGAGARPTP